MPENSNQPLLLSCAPLTVVENDGVVTFTLRAIKAGGTGFDGRSVPKFAGVLPEAVVTLVNRGTLTVALDVATLALGDNGVTVIDIDKGTRLAEGATVQVTEAP